jgi:hypothetical protein
MQNTPYAAQQQQVNKFLEATRRLGAQMDQDQGTTRVIYDTSGPGSGRTTFDFFDLVTSKTYPATNLDQNRFQPGEGMVIKEISFTDLLGAYDFSSALSFGIVSFFIGNNRVIKDLPLSAFSTIAALNPLNYPSGTSISEEEPTANIPTTIRLRTNLVIPPQIQFKATLRLPFVAVGSCNIKMSVKGYGKLFNPGQNY